MARHTAKSHKIRKVEILVIQTEICIEPDVYIYADDAEISVYSEEESKVFKKIKGIPEQYIIELLTRE